MNYVSANNEYHVPLHVKPVQPKDGVTDAKIIIILKYNKSGICCFVERTGYLI